MCMSQRETGLWGPEGQGKADNSYNSWEVRTERKVQQWFICVLHNGRKDKGAFGMGGLEGVGGWLLATRIDREKRSSGITCASGVV